MSRPLRVISPPERLPGKGGNRKYYQCDNGHLYLQISLAKYAKKSQGHFNKIIREYGWNHPRLLDPQWNPTEERERKESALRKMRGNAVGTEVNYDQSLRIVEAMIEDAKHNVKHYHGKEKLRQHERRWYDDSVKFLLNQNGALGDLLSMVKGVNVDEALSFLSGFVREAQGKRCGR